MSTTHSDHLLIGILTIYAARDTCIWMNRIYKKIFINLWKLLCFQNMTKYTTAVVFLCFYPGVNSFLNDQRIGFHTGIFVPPSSFKRSISVSIYEDVRVLTDHKKKKEKKKHFLNLCRYLSIDWSVNKQGKMWESLRDAVSP